MKRRAFLALPVVIAAAPAPTEVVWVQVFHSRGSYWMPVEAPRKSRP